MRTNLPVTQHEFILPAGTYLVSKTDPGGKLTYANRDFCEVSGYSQAELIGAPHNLVRHPDMPVEAFADLWATLKAGRPWTGFVKNRRKNGDHYWVQANVTPIRENGKVTEYMSVRSIVARADVERLEQGYRAFREGNMRGYAVRDGAVVRAGVPGHLRALMPRSVMAKTALFGACASLAPSAAYFGAVHMGLPALAACGAASAAAAAAGMAAALLTRRLILRPIQGLAVHLLGLSEGIQLRVPETRRHDEVGVLADAVKSLQIKSGFDLDDARKSAESALRIQNALDSTSSNVMIADNAGQIIYLNKAVTAMLQKVEPELRKALPTFEANRVLGKSLDEFHANPSHQRNLLARIDRTHESNIKVAALSFRLLASPIADQAGQRIGTVIEWIDRTAEIAVEQEVGNIVQAAARGDFGQRVGVEGKQGFFKQLAGNINDLMETSSTGLAEVVRVLSALAKGDLTEKITNSYEGTFGRLKDDSNATVDKLGALVQEIRESTETINTAAKEIAMGNADLSQRTEEQASSLQETAASMEQLTSTVKQNADNARQANRMAETASQIAVKGGQVVSEVVDTMEAITASSKKIVDIISVIDGIAFQTNILALNAAVEAARAGEQGRGFAVVATEVRNLAQRSANAAKEIKGLIGDSVDKVGAGSKLVADAGTTMEEIVSSVRKVTDIMAQITSASAEQSEGIEQVNQAVAQMDQVTQQNAALVEQAAAAAESMEEQAQGLSKTVSVFRMAGAAERPALAAPVKARALASPGKPKASPGTKSTAGNPVVGKPASGPRRTAAEAASTDEWEEF
jgi:methyl-accepting chemotaxis protein